MLRIKLNFPPRYIDINYNLFHSLRQPIKTIVLEYLINLNQIYLRTIENQLDTAYLKFNSLATNSCKLPDSATSNKKNYFEWNDINNLIRSNPLNQIVKTKLEKFNKIANKYRLIQFKRSPKFFDNNTLEKTKQTINEINKFISRKDLFNIFSPVTSLSIYADSSRNYLFNNLGSGLYTITPSTHKKQFIPKFIITTLSFGLNFVPWLSTYPSESIDENFNDFEHRLRWKFFWQQKNFNETNETETTKFLPRSLRNSVRSNPPTNKKLTNYATEIKKKFKKNLQNKTSDQTQHRQLALSINKTIKYFKANSNSLVVKPCDKGSGAVIIDKQFYIDTIESYLSYNVYFFEVIQNDPTIKLLALVKRELDALKSRSLIDYKTYLILQPDSKTARCPFLYGIPKIHKTPITFRPIVSGNGHPTEKLSIFIDHLLKPYVTLHNLYLKDSTDLLNHLEVIGRINPSHTILFSLDIVSMYTNIPLDELIESVMNRIAKHPPHMLKTKHTQYKPELIRKLLETILHNNFFKFSNKFYHQKHGIAMGTPCACSISDIYTCDWLTNSFSLLGKMPFFYKQYRDDGFGIWTESQEALFEFVNNLNHLHPTFKFKLNYGKQLNYLDLNIKLNSNGLLTTETNYKPTDSFAYLHAKSNHPSHCLDNIGLSQSIRHIRNCSNHSTYLHNIHQLKYNLTRKGHDFKLVSKKVSKFKFQMRAQLLSYSKPKRLQRTPLVITYNKGMPSLNKIIRSMTENLLNESSLKAIGGFPIVGYRIQRSIGSKIISAKS